MRGVWAGLLVCLLVVGGTTLVTSLSPKTYRSQALIDVSDLTTPSNKLAQQLQSLLVLNQVATELDLARRWASRFAPERLTEDGLYRLLKHRMSVRLRADEPLVEISYCSEDQDEAALVANKIAEVFRAQPFGNRALVLEAAEPNARPIQPNKMLNMLMGLGAGLFLGAMIGIPVALISAWRAKRRQPPRTQAADTSDSTAQTFAK